jgi:NTP pyrophosphatase (non-canonical NTP hydrolase)
MTIEQYQEAVEHWIKEYGIRYFDEKTNALLLIEEIGEVARLIAREYGEQSFKEGKRPGDIKKAIADEMADVLFVLTCLANQMKIDLKEAITENLNKKTKRDAKRHVNNDKLR